MGSPPDANAVPRHISLVGPGRAGQSFHDAFEAVGWATGTVFNRGDDLTNAAQAPGLLLLAVPDDQVASVAQSIEPGVAVVAHCAGSLGLAVLGDHARVASLHPLVSLPDATRGTQRLLDQCLFAVDGDDIARTAIQDFGGVAITIGDDQRALYHATAAVAANHLTALCHQVEILADAVGVPIDAYWRLMFSTLENVTNNGANASLTGPAARGDWATVAAHLDALPSQEHQLYEAASRRAAVMSGRRWPTYLDDGDKATSRSHETNNRSDSR